MKNEQINNINDIINIVEAGCKIVLCSDNIYKLKYLINII